MNKKGQFFLIGALVIAAILLSIGIIYNQAKIQAPDTKATDLSKDSNFEGSKVIDSGVYNSLTNDQILYNLQSLAANYSVSNPDSQFVIVFGNATHATIANYTASTAGYVHVGLAGDRISTSAQDIIPTSPDQGSINLNVSGNNYNFDLRGGQNFYILVRKTHANETFVATA